MPDEKKTIADLAPAVAAACDCDPKELEKVTQVIWYPYRSAADALAHLQFLASTQRDTTAEINRLLSVIEPSVFRRGQPCPLRDKTVVLEMFESEEEYRVFSAGEGGLARFRLSKRGGTVSTTDYPFDRFVEALATEYDTVAGSTHESARADGRRDTTAEIIEALAAHPEAQKHVIEWSEAQDEYEDEDVTEEEPNGAAPQSEVVGSTTIP
jgi:hypothetical protein